MNQNVSHSPEVSLDSYPGQGHSSGSSQSESLSHPDTASLLKSFIKDNLHIRYESSGGRSSSDESSSAELDLLRARNNNSQYDLRDSVTPEPQPLTRSNVTLHDGIWRTDVNDDQDSASGSQKPVSLSPPLKGLRMVHQHSLNDGRKSWERGFLEQSLSDAESDQSYSSQDTMILKSTKEAALGHLKYMELYDSTRASSSGTSPSMRRPNGLVHPSDVTSINGHTSRASGSGEGHNRGTSPSRHVRFANDVQFQDNEIDASALSAQPQRSLNVDYARLLGRGVSGNGEPGDQDDGYESTDNASSTSSSSNGTDQQAGTVSLPETIRESPDENGPTNLKTDYGYVDRTRVPNFRRMNMELRKKAVIKSAQNSAKSSVEDKLRALCISTDANNDNGEPLSQNQDSPMISPLMGKPLERIEFHPRDASSPVLHDAHTSSSTRGGMYRIGDLSIISNNNQTYNPSQNTTNVAIDNQSELNLAADRPGGCKVDSKMSESEILPVYTHTDSNGEVYHRTDNRWDSRTPASIPIPKQPRRPAPVLRDNKTSPARSYDNFTNMNAVQSEQNRVLSIERPTSEMYYPSHLSSAWPRPMSEMYRSQPQLQIEDEVQNLGPMSSRFKSEPQLQRSEFYGDGTDLSMEPRETVVDGHTYGQFQGNYQSEVCGLFHTNSHLTSSSYNIEPQYTNPMENQYMSKSPFRSESPYGEQKASLRTDVLHRPASPNRPQSPQLFTNLPLRQPSPVRSISPSRSVSSERDGSEHGRSTLYRYPTQAMLETMPQPARDVQNDRPDQYINTITQPLQPNDIPGVFVYRSGPQQVHQTTSDEHLNTSGSTGSNDSGIEHSSADTNHTNAYPQNLSPSDASRGRRAPVNYTLDDTSRDPMGLVEKVKRRRESSPVAQLQRNQTPPLSKFPEKSSAKGTSLLCQPGEFTTPSTKDFSRMRTHNRVSPVSHKLQPMKALPITNNMVDVGMQPEWTHKLDTTAKKMLDSHGSKMKDEYARYLQLYSKFQKQKSCEDRMPTTSTGEATFVDGVSMKSRMLVSQTSIPGYVESSSYGEVNDSTVPDLQPDGNIGYSSTLRSPRPVSSAKYMRTADIYRMLEAQRGPPRISRSQPTTPTKITTPDWGPPQMGKQMTSSFESLQTPYSEYVRHTRESDRGYCYGNEAVQQAQPSGVNAMPQSRGGATIHAKNSDIYSLYTGTAQGCHIRAAEGGDAVTKPAGPPASFQI